MTSRYLLDCTNGGVLALVEAARDAAPVSGLTHNFYRYPARFSPRFVRAAIEAFSEPGDLILDPFMGGGTTLVEAMATGRHAIGTDISALAAFIAQVKTTVYSEADLSQLRRWSRHTASLIHMHKEASLDRDYAAAGYYRHMESRSTWRLRKAIEQSLRAASNLDSSKLEHFARCVILRTGQWALDGRKHLPTIAAFRAALSAHASEMIAGARQLRTAVATSGCRRQPFVRCLNRSTTGLEVETITFEGQRPKLIVTSPPYPGVHVLYHRWQVDGRKETPAPFWIANKLDGDGASYYTMGDRKASGLRTYFDNLRESLHSVAALCSEETTIVQVMAFSDPAWQLPRYLSVADDAGLREHFLPMLKDVGDRRLWRLVPNRKWHANQKGKTNGSQEVVLFHRLQT
jgi:DNA methylase